MIELEEYIILLCWQLSKLSQVTTPSMDSTLGELGITDIDLTEFCSILEEKFLIEAKESDYPETTYLRAVVDSIINQVDYDRIQDELIKR